MSDSSIGFTVTELIAMATEILLAADYRQISSGFPDWNTPTSRLFEDEYNIIGVVVFETCTELLHEWTDRQGSLVSLISGHVGKVESKTWDGYLVLLTPALAPSEETELEKVRYNTVRLRKLVATGDDLKHPTDVERVLRSLLPLGLEAADVGRSSALDLLPRILADKGINEEVTQLLIGASQKQLPLMERLHERPVDQ